VTPIYASDRAQLQSWYAYRQPAGRYIIWDGGVNQSNTSTGLWCPFTGNIVDAPDKLIAGLPKDLVVAGYINGDRVTVVSFPHARDILPVTPYTKSMRYFYPDPEARASFMDEILHGPELLEGTSCDMVDVEQLPEDNLAALAHLRERYGLDGVARHPWSVWTPKRSCHFASTFPPNAVRDCKIREIVCEDQMNLIDYVQVWATIEYTLNVIPLYPGDDEVDCDFWKIHKPITLYSIGDHIVGYE